LSCRLAVKTALKSLVTFLIKFTLPVAFVKTPVYQPFLLAYKNTPVARLFTGTAQTIHVDLGFTPIVPSLIFY